nr:AAA family ATPase [Actinomycetota bacterium]
LGAKRGAEELSQLLNQVFGPVTTAIHRHGGSVISFGGDSVTCWFDGDDGAGATAAAWDLLSFIQSFREQEADGPARDIDIKVAVASGLSRRIRVGRAEHSYMDVLAGEVVEKLSAEAKQLQAGEVAVTPEVVDALSEAVIRTVTTDRRVRHLVEALNATSHRITALEAVAIDEAVASEWLLPPVHERIQQGLQGLMAELREVVALFVGFEGIDHVMDDDAGKALDAVVSRAQDVFAKYEGVVLQTLIDDKGAHLYAVFGASVSHEDEARRAVVAALELTESPESGAPSQIRVGIAKGVAYVGSYGGPTRMTYGIHGPIVSLAARIMQQTPPGMVYVSEEITSEPGHRANFSMIGPTEFKGFDRPVTIHKAIAIAGAGSSSAARRMSQGGLVGRDKERSVVAASLAQLHAGKGGAILIEGAAGIGKSRLLADFVEQAELLGTTVITTSGEEIEQATAFYAWRSVLRKLFGGEDLEAENRLLEFIAADPWLAERQGLLATMVSARVEDSDLTAGMEPELRGENTLRLLTAIVRGAPRTAPLVLVIDDGHWVDSASWAIAERVVREVPSLLLVIATRPFGEGSGRFAPAEYGRLLEDEHTEHVVLSELLPAEVMQLVERCLGVTSVPGPVTELIIEQADGHPYYSEEIAFALRDAGLLIIENGESRLAPNVQDLHDVDFPTTVQDIIIGRFDRLSARQQSILKVASVIGREFSVETLVEIYPGEMDAAEATESLRTLVVLDLVQEVLLHRSRYRFRHAITRDIAYGLLLFAQKSELHRALAVSLEAEHAADLDAVATTLAHHWRNSLSPESEGSDVDKALDYLGRAGRKSLRNFAHRESIGFLTDAIDLATGKGELGKFKPSQKVPAGSLARMEQDLAEAYLGMGRVDHSADHFERSLELHGYPVGHGKFGVAARLLAASALQLRHRLARADVAVSQAEAREDLIEAATAYERLMKIYYYANDPGALITAAVSGLNLAEKAGTSPVLARIYANMSIVAGIVPIHRLARLYSRRSREVADEVDRPPEHAWVRLATSVYGVGVGDWETTEQDLRDSLDLYKRLGDSRQMEETWGTTGEMLMIQGRFAEVYEIGEQLKESGSSRDDAQGELWGWLFQGASLLRQGDYRTALSRFRNGELLLDAGVGAINVGWLYGFMAETYWRLDDQDRARAAAASASQALYAERPGVVFALDGFTGVADVYLGQWATGRTREAVSAKTASELAVKKLRAFSKVFPIGRPAAHRYAGMVKEQSGNPDAAAKEWEQGLEIAVELRMPYEEGRIRLNLGRLGSGNRSHLEKALELFEATSAAHFADLTRAALRETAR